MLSNVYHIGEDNTKSNGCVW